jgi:hypothetical protein
MRSGEVYQTHVKPQPSGTPEIIPDDHVSAIYLRLYYEFKIIYQLMKGTRYEALR